MLTYETADKFENLRFPFRLISLINRPNNTNNPINLYKITTSALHRPPYPDTADKESHPNPYTYHRPAAWFTL